MFAFAGEHGANFNLLDPGGVDEPAFHLVNLSAGADHEFLRALGFGDIIARIAANETFAQFDDFIFSFVNSLDPDAVSGPTILFADDNVLGHIHQFARHVT